MFTCNYVSIGNTLFFEKRIFNFITFPTHVIITLAEFLLSYTKLYDCCATT